MFQSNELICYLFKVLAKSYLLLLFLSSVLTTIKCEPSLHAQLNYFEVIHTIDIKHNKLVKRSADHLTDSVDHLVSFRAIDRDFDLHLTQSKDIINPHFNVITADSKGRRRPVIVAVDQHYSGTVDGVEGSRVSAHIDPETGLMTAAIHTGDDVYEVEPIWRHSETERNNLSSMIVFRHSDVKHSDNGTQESKHFCDFVKIDANGSEYEDEYEKNHWLRQKRDTPVELSTRSDGGQESQPKATQCTLYLVADYSFHEHMGGKDVQITTNYMIHIVDRVNNIFKNTEWTIDETKRGYKGMGFYVKGILIHEEESTEPGHYNADLKYEPITPNALLERFSLEKYHSQFCLAHLFTHRKFEGSVLGLAYVASARGGSAGGVCSGSYQKRFDGIIKNLYLNTGLTTTKNLYGGKIITREAVLVTTHEFGHNWGSEHDPDTDECSPKASYGGSYVMYAYSVTGYEENNRFFSPCSKRSIRSVLDAKSPRCFIQPEKSYCGNSIVEEGEDCDEGLLLNNEGYKQGLCCNDRCQFIPGSECSDKNSECCSSCRIAPPTQVCRKKDEFNCREESRCDGDNRQCPEPKPIVDNTVCHDRGQCRGGRCVPYCETINQETCMCEERRDACLRCCRQTNSSVCVPVLPRDELLDGTPCRYGFCEKARCERKVQDFVERFWDVIEEININTFITFMRDNIVGVVIVVSLIIWIPLSCAISYYDRQLAEERRRRSASHQSYGRRPITRQFSRRLSRPGLLINGQTVSNQAYYPFGY